MYGPRFLVEAWYRAPQIDLKLMLIKGLGFRAPTVGLHAQEGKL